jgi:O-methyltransferase
MTESKITSTDIQAADLYLDLMKRVLTDSIFLDHPLSHLVPHRIKEGTPLVKRAVLLGLRRLLTRYQIRLVEPGDSLTDQERTVAVRDGTFWPARAHSMIGMRRLDNLQVCVESVLRQGVQGDLIETGVWRGGACIFMRAVLAAHQDETRNVWVADSFEGLPPPSPEMYVADANDRHHEIDLLAVSLEEVQSNFRRYNLLDSRVRFLKGWFKDTLPTAPISQLAVIRLDGDMYESTIQALDALYSKLSIGGFVIIDDYFLKPCAQAVQDFRRTNGVNDTILDIDGKGAYWQRLA